MKEHFRYIIAGLVLLIFYLLYLILHDKYSDYQINEYITFLEQDNAARMETIAEKELYNAYVRTPAYETRIAKATQGKKLPGEEIIHIISSEDATQNTTINVSEQIQSAQKSDENPTK